MTDDARSQAFQRLRTGDKQADIATDFGVSQATVSALARELRGGPASRGDEAVLLSNLPDDDVVCDYEAGALRLTQITSKRLT